MQIYCSLRPSRAPQLQRPRPAALNFFWSWQFPFFFFKTISTPNMGIKPLLLSRRSQAPQTLASFFTWIFPHIQSSLLSKALSHCLCLLFHSPPCGPWWPHTHTRVFHSLSFWVGAILLGLTSLSRQSCLVLLESKLWTLAWPWLLFLPTLK